MENTTVEMLETRLKSIANAREFFKMDCNEHLFEDKVYNSGFVLDVLKKKKKLIPSSSYENLDLKRMKYIKHFDRINLFRIIEENEEMTNYIPNNSRSEQFTRNTLIIIRHVNPGLFYDLRNDLIENKNKLVRNIRRTTKIYIDQMYKDKLTKFQSQTKHALKKTFVLSKNIKENLESRNLNIQLSNNNMNVNNQNNNQLRNNMDFCIVRAKLKDLIESSSNQLDENNYLIYNLCQNKALILEDSLNMLFQ